MLFKKYGIGGYTDRQTYIQIIPNKESVLVVICSGRSTAVVCTRRWAGYTPITKGIQGNPPGGLLFHSEALTATTRGSAR